MSATTRQLDNSLEQKCSDAVVKLVGCECGFLVDHVSVFIVCMKHIIFSPHSHPRHCLSCVYTKINHHNSEH